MQYVSSLDEEVMFESTTPSCEMPGADAPQALMNAWLDESFPWHRIRRLPRK